MIRKGLGAKLALAFVGIALASIILVSLVINLTLSRRFETYVHNNHVQRNMRLATALAQSYQEGGTWESIGVDLSHVAMMEGVDIMVLNGQGGVEWDTVELSHQLMQGDGVHRMMGMMRIQRDGQAHRILMPIVVNGQKVGDMYVTSYGPKAFWSEEDLAFKVATIRSLGYSAFWITPAALLMSLLIARRLTSPLILMTNVARKMEGGDLRQRVPLTRVEDELDHLGQALNHLAESLENQERLRKALTADVAHELRTPLATLRSHLEAFQDGVWDPTPERLQACYDELMRLVRLVGDLEQLAQAESAPQLDLETLDLSGVTKHAVDTFQIQFEKKGVSLLPQLNPGVYVRGDRDKMVQVLINLLSNALKYTPSGGRVTVGVLERGKRALITVTDTGPGIPESDLPFIFERFYRGDKSRTRATGGAGIGLSIVKALVQAHGGQVSVESKVGKGSTFSVVLPLVQQGEG